MSTSLSASERQSGEKRKGRPKAVVAAGVQLPLKGNRVEKWDLIEKPEFTLE